MTKKKPKIFRSMAEFDKEYYPDKIPRDELPICPYCGQPYAPPYKEYERLVEARKDKKKREADLKKRLDELGLEIANIGGNNNDD